MRAPKYKLCTACGRRYHKVAVRIPSGVVRGKFVPEIVVGYCPRCWDGYDGQGAYAPERGDRVWAEERGLEIVYDLRRRKPELTKEER